MHMTFLIANTHAMQMRLNVFLCLADILGTTRIYNSGVGGGGGVGVIVHCFARTVFYVCIEYCI